MDREAWNERYRSQELVWGAEPNRFVEEALAGAAPRGRALDLACGQGRNALWLAGLGLVVGIPVALVFVRVLRSVLFGVNPHDPLTIAASILLVLAVAALAAWIPARRAAKIDPMEALRYE